MRIIALLLLLAVPTSAQVFPGIPATPTIAYMLPHVVEGIPISILIGSVGVVGFPEDLSIQVNGKTEYIKNADLGVHTFTPKATGFAIIRYSSPLTIWTYIDGAMFTGHILKGRSRLVGASGPTTLAIANGNGRPESFTLYRHTLEKYEDLGTYNLAAYERKILNVSTEGNYVLSIAASDPNIGMAAGYHLPDGTCRSLPVQLPGIDPR